MFSGIAVSGGYGVGKIFIVSFSEQDYSASVFSDAANEKRRLNQAAYKFTEITRNQVANIRKASSKSISDILKGHIAMLDDPYMLGEMLKKIESGFVAEEAVDTVCREFFELFDTSSIDFTRQRALDIEDIRRNLLALLLGEPVSNISQAPKNCVLAAVDFLPSMAGMIKDKNIQGLISENGGYTGHNAIIARAMDIPAVFSSENIVSKISAGDKVLVDGTDGKIIVFPTKKQLAQYDKKRAERLIEKESLNAFLGKPTLTEQKAVKHIYCNISHADDTSDVVKFSGEGIGLFRTEFLFINRETPPSEEEQFEEYSSAASLLEGKPLVIRTLDIGGDKAVPSLEIVMKDNPFGKRAIRYCLENPQFFKKQVKAILRAGVYGNVKMMIPLVTTLDEVLQTKRIIAESKEELKTENKAFSDAPLGIMVETPAAAMISDILAKESDFFAVGTNDLTAYVMVADRNDTEFDISAEVLQQPVLRMIKTVIKNATDAGIEVCVCGEAAANEELIPLLLRWGADSLSVDPSEVLKTRKIISKC